ncbi:acetylcholine receptor subunit alpha-type acr-16-like [Amphibalanus amphitrite]|uniref:acetylcholine receptor subunit alpha-type acr-16-like n=1 Tax=Amphibalanus amphitrite TaxID=1232801 RepID=UPI001C90A321|nr:acetylcholine receptor subunit alpha-type acr-16-like [Amphibalanus amphitrite]
MSRLTISLLVALAGLASSDTGANEELYIPSLTSPMRHLMVRPVSNPSEQISVSIELTLVDVDFHEADNTATLGAWLHHEWLDNRLGWSGGNVTSTRVFAVNIWRPDLAVYDRVPVTSNWFLSMPAIVHQTGKVVFVPPVSFTVRCQRRRTDTQDRVTCPFKLGSWTHNVEEMELVLKSKTINTDEMINNGRWAVESTSLAYKERQYDCCEGIYGHIQGEIVLKPQLS